MRKITYFLIIIAVFFSVSACTNKQATALPIKGTALHLGTTESVLLSGKTTAPWSEISFLSSLMFRSLFVLDAVTNEVKSDLAKSYEISEDGLVYTIELHDDLYWSDGEKISAEDVMFSFEAALRSNRVVPFLSSALLAINGAEGYQNKQVGILTGLDTNENMIYITLKQPVYNFIDILTQFAILPEHMLCDADFTAIYDDDFWLNPVVSGMYKFNEFVLSESLNYIYNDKYTDAVPHIESISLRADYDIHDLDYYTTTDVTEILEFRAASYMEEYHIEDLFYRYLVFDIKQENLETDPVLGDVRVRQAIAYAIDNESLVKNIYYNIGTVINTGLVDNRKDRAYTYDPEKAMALLAEAEYDFSRPLVLLCTDSDDITLRFVEAMTEDLREVGLTVEIMLSGSIYTSEYDIALKSVSAFDISAWYEEYDSSHVLSQNVFGQERTFDSLIDQLNASKNDEDFLTALDALQKLEYEKLYKYPIFMLNYYGYVNTDRVILPVGSILSRPAYRYDVHFEDWQIVSDTAD
ncbi:MAG: ABC transporter substrate-binding protein [Bacillota bacterium]